MSKINQFSSSTNFDQLRSDINEALKEVAKKYGVSMKAGNASYNSECATFKLEITTLGEGGTVENKEAKDFKTYASMYGLKAEDLGRVFKFKGADYKITGLKPRSRNPIVIQHVGSSRGYKMSSDTVVRLLQTV